MESSAYSLIYMITRNIFHRLNVVQYISTLVSPLLPIVLFLYAIDYVICKFWPYTFMSQSQKNHHISSGSIGEWLAITTIHRSDTYIPLNSI